MLLVCLVNLQSQWWLIPRLTFLSTAYPHITVHLVAAGGVIDFTKTNVDLALRRNDFKWNDNLCAVRSVLRTYGHRGSA